MIKTLCGSNSYMIDSQKNHIITQFIKEFGDLSLEQINCDEVEYQVIYDSLRSLAFLSTSKLVVLFNPSSNKQFCDNFEKIIPQISDSTDLLIIESDLDKRLGVYKSLKKLTDFNELNELAPHQLADWIVETVKNSSGKISQSNANYLIELTGINQLRLSNEIAKLINYDSEISRQSINLLVESTPQSTIFQLLDSAFSGRHEELLKIYNDQRQQKVEPQQIIAMLIWQIHILALVKAAGNIPVSEIASKARLNPFVVNKSLSITRKLEFNKIKTITRNLLELDLKLKSRTIDIDEALLGLLLSVSN